MDLFLVCIGHNKICNKHNLSGKSKNIFQVRHINLINERIENMKKVLLILMSTLILSGCVSQTTTVTIDGKASAVMEKKFSFGSSMMTDSLSKAVGDKFLQSVRTQNPDSLLKYKNSEDMGYIAVIKTENIAKKDIFASEPFFTPKNKKNLDCKQIKDETQCKANFVVNISSPEIEKTLKENQLTYQDLEPYILTLKLPVKADSHNAKFFDLNNFIYIWEIPAGVETPVNIDFTIK